MRQPKRMEDRDQNNGTEGGEPNNEECHAGAGFKEWHYTC